jgi:hypothetical protein
VREELPAHERMINPWFKYFDLSLAKSLELVATLEESMGSESSYRSVLKPYLQNNLLTLKGSNFTIAKEDFNWSEKLKPLMAKLNSFNA